MENKNKRNRKKPQFSLTWLYVIVALVLGYLFITGDNSAVFSSSSATEADKDDVTYTDFKRYVEDGYVARVEANKNDGKLRMFVNDKHYREVFGKGKNPRGNEEYISVEYPSNDQLETFLTQQQELQHFKGDVKYYTESDTWMRLLYNFAPLLLLIFFWVFIFGRMGKGGGGFGGIFSVGKSRAKLVDKDDENAPKVTFADVAGQNEAKQEVQEIVEFLKNPKKYTELGGKIPKGALLVGPPGTGKTLLAKAVAGEADVPFFTMSGSDFVEMFVGVGASRVRDLFSQAKEKSPCIIFIDEIDAVGRARSARALSGGNDERESTLNQLLTEMDGFGTNSGVIILAATNRADILDKALLRAGRFDRQIHVELPEVNERKEIFKVHLRPLKIEETLDLDFLARQTPGFSGADIANVCNEAALIAARHDHPSVTKDDFLAAVDRIIGGLEKKSKVMTAEEKRTIALHEAGHATISWHLQYANPLVKVTIVPRGRALGAAWYLPEERQISTREQMLDELCSLLGGRAAEELFTGHISSGAMNDLERVTKQVYAMIAYMGMSDRLPNLCYYNNEEYQFQKPYSEETARLIDAEVQRMIAEQYERAKALLQEKREGHAQLAQVLVEREVIFASDVEAIFGKRPWQSRTEELLEENEAAERVEQTEEEPVSASEDTEEPTSE
ncbi:MAG: ATP-dependent metallopeptidase FtsH/Yme1/Tma family protein [Bacteroidaceae bacterium]|nr:ATP-dependent metallopeptidase FtsH/Yme1/Tma family protein [Bacteroidaceae bacterium]